MGIFSFLYNEVLYRPLFNALVFGYVFLPFQDIGFSIVALTILVRLLLVPFLVRGQRVQRELAALQPEIKRIQEKFKKDRAGQNRALMELYAERRVNPFSGCLPLIVQLFVFIALFRVFQNGLDAAQLSFLYSFIPSPESINPVSFGIVDLSQRNIPLALLAGITQYIQGKVTARIQPAPPQTENSFARSLQLQSLYVFPVLTLVWSLGFASAFALYWTTSNVFGIIQDTLIASRYAPRKGE